MYALVVYAYKGVERFSTSILILSSDCMGMFILPLMCFALYSSCSGREVKQEDIIKGYEYEDGKYVLFEDKSFYLSNWN